MKKPIRVELHGGSKDGAVYRTDSRQRSERDLAFMYSGPNGSDKPVGSRYTSAPEANRLAMAANMVTTPSGEVEYTGPPLMKWDIYELVERVEEEDEIVVRYEYQGKHS